MRVLRLSILPLFVALGLLLPLAPTLAQTATPTPDYRAVVEVGMVQIMAGPTPDPASGWLVCDGSTVSRSTYANLFAVIGTTYGDGDGETTFELPDLRGRQVVGTGSATGFTSARTLGQIFGEELQALDVGEMAIHSHGVTDPGHVHRERLGNGASAFQLIGGGGTNPTIANGVTTSTTALNTVIANTGITIDNAGDGYPFNIIDPSLALHFVIWSGTVPLSIVAAPEEDIVVTVVVVFPSHTPTPTATPTLTPTAGPSPTPTATATPTGVSPYESVTSINSQPVVMEYRITPGDAAIFGMLFVIAGLLIYRQWMEIKRRRG